MPTEQTRTIEGVEIFSVGKWNGDVYTEADLDEMVRAFNETSETCRPALKLGHDDGQALIQSDGYPAAGWVGKLYRKGKKLIADFIDIPEKIYNLIENKAYRKVSSEIYWGIDCGENRYNRMLAAVALLGADMPAVMDLKDIYATHGVAFTPIGERKFYELDSEGLTIKKYTDSNGGGQKMEENEKLQAELKTYRAQAEEAQKELSDLREYKKTSDEKLKELAEKAKSSELDANIAELEKENLLTPAMKPYVREILSDEKKVYTIKDGDKESQLSKFDVLKSIIKLFSAKEVNKEEISIDGDPIPQSKGDEEAISKYMAENKCSYSQAYRSVLRGRVEKK